MGASPKFKVFNHDGEYIAAFKSLHDAAQFISLEDGREVRLGHSSRNMIWRNASDWYCVITDQHPSRNGDGTISHRWVSGRKVEESFEVVFDHAVRLGMIPTEGLI